MPSKRAMDNRPLAARLALGAAVFVLAAPGLALAQSASSSLSQFYGGYAASGLSSFESPVDTSTTDANGNLVVTNGVISSAGAGSVFAGTGVGSTSSGGGGAAVGTASAIGNNLSVNVSGEYNTVVVNSTQTNTGDVSATTVLNGKVNLDGGQ